MPAVEAKYLIFKRSGGRPLPAFESKCAFCNQEATLANRGIVADHLTPANAFGELVLGNVLPACQDCNDSRGEVDWRSFVRKKFPGDGEAQIRRIDEHLASHSYQVCSPETSLSPEELAEYEKLKADFEDWLTRARVLRRSVAEKIAHVE